MSYLVPLRPARDGIEDELDVLHAHWAGLEAMVAADPAVASGWMTPEIRPMRIVVA